ncbi:MAG TPA: tocopherol cyclase family protein [Planctomycetota bacterium]|nr:tocopherol cyclase family protein [Planctomycetota bacterium]
MLGDELNALRWLGKRQRGFHEVWYLTCVDPATGDAYWFRYTIETPLVGEVEVGLWAFATPKANPTAGLCLHDRRPLSKFADKSTSEKGFRIEVDKYFLESGRATGKVGEGARMLEWDLKWQPNGIGFEHVSGLLTSLGVAKSAVNSGNLAIEVEGTIKIAGKAVKVTKWPAHQSHTWGSRHAESWAWAHCNAFAEDKTAVFEGVSARVQKLGLLLPAATPIFFRRNGVEHDWSSVGTVWSNRSTYAPGSWKFEAENQEVLVRGTASAPAERTVSVEYHDPAGPFYVDHCTSGDLSLEVWKRVGFRWELETKLTSQGTTAFEIAGRTRSSNVGRTLDLVDTKVVGDPAAAAKPVGAAG